MRLDHIRLVARQELTDILRNRQVWIGLLLQPVIFMLTFGFIGYISDQRSDAFATREFKALVRADDRDAAPFVEVLENARFRVKRTDDVDTPVVGGDAEIGLDVPRGAVEAMREGRRIQLSLRFVRARDQSQVAVARARIALDAFATKSVEQRLQEQDLPRSMAHPFDVLSTDVATTDRGARLELARLLPGLLLIQSSSLVNIAAQRISGSKEKRTFEPLITLPIRRPDLLAGAGVASFLVGLIPAAMFVVPVVVLALLPVAFAAGLSSPLLVGGALIAGAPLLAAMLSSLGLAVGTLTRTAEGGAAMGAVAFVPLMGVGFLFMFIDNLPSTWPWFATPVYGTALFVREAIAEGINLPHLALSAAGTIGLAVALLGLATRALETERSVLRPS